MAKGIIEREQDVRITERRVEVAKRFGIMNKSDMAKDLGVSKGTIDSDIRFLREQGIIKGKSPTILPLEIQEKIRKRREYFESIYNASKEKLTVKQIADLLGISYTTAYRDFEALKKEGRLKDFDEENGKEENQDEHKRHPELEKRIKVIYQKIMSLYKEGKIDKAIELLRLLGERIIFDARERKTFNAIMAILNKALERQNKSQSPRESGEKTIDDKGDER